MRFAAVLLVSACAGCAGCPQTQQKGPVTACTLPNGDALGVGEQGEAGDGCNTCVCRTDFTLDCTTLACDVDAGAPADAGSEDDAGTADAGTADAGTVDEGPCHDVDGDGFYDCIDPDHPERPQVVDCDDTRFHVQPGGVEFPDTPEDDNCDGSNDDYLRCDCGGSSTDATALGAGMDLCGPEVLSATKSGAAIQFGLVDAYSDVIQPRVRVRGNADGSSTVLGNTCLTTLSSGDATGTQTNVGATHCGYPDPDPLHEDQDPEICDLAQVHFHLHAPPNAQGFSFDFLFMSQEWPEFLCLVYNDTFYAIVDQDQAVRDGAATNTAFDATNRPITVNVGFFENPSSWSQPLDGTPYGQPDPGVECPSTSDSQYQPGCQEPSYCASGDFDRRTGSGSGWLTTSVPVTPGQDFDLTLSIHDEFDDILDSLVLLDNFRWLPNAPPLQTVKGGG